MIGLVLALVGLVCIVYSMLVVTIALGGLIAIVWQLFGSVASRISLRFRVPHELSTHSSRSAKAVERLNRFHAKSMHSPPRRLKLGNDITIIAGDRTPGKALYSEMDPPPRARLSEN